MERDERVVIGTSPRKMKVERVCVTCANEDMENGEWEMSDVGKRIPVIIIISPSLSLSVNTFVALAYYTISQTARR